MEYALAAGIGYLLGSIPFGWIIARVGGGIEIRERGSGNIGATNVWRVLGWRPGLLCFILDLMKGVLPVLITMTVAGERPAILAGAAAVLGHMFPAWLKGRGGKGVATAAGAFLVLAPLPCLNAILAFAVVGPLATRTVSAGSIAGAVILIWSAWQTSSIEVALLALLSGALTIWRHRGNLRRLADGTESRIWKGIDLEAEE
jgi:glycerol-3-phosphate acyltransferase PlsY